MITERQQLASQAEKPICTSLAEDTEAQADTQKQIAPHPQEQETHLVRITNGADAIACDRNLCYNLNMR